VNQDDEIAPPKRSPSFSRALRGSVRRNPWMVVLLLTFVGIVVLRAFMGGDVRSMLINGVAVGLVVFVISMTVVPAIRKQNEEERVKRDAAGKPPLE
jgi:membrane protein YdbS with pleckstrin-like domain